MVHGEARSTPPAENNDVDATTTNPSPRDQASVSDRQRLDRNSGVLLRRAPELLQPPTLRKRDTRSLRRDKTLEKNGFPEREPKRTNNRKKDHPRPTRSSLRRRALNYGAVSTSETGPSREDASDLTVPATQQSMARDPSPPPRSETVGRDDEDPSFDDIHSFLAPFDMNHELGEWQFSKKEGKWWRLNMTTNTMISAPTADMFF